MKILLVTDQKIHLEGDNILGPSNFTNCLRRLTQLGELHLCAVECKDTNKTINVFNDNITECLEKENITFISKSYLWPSVDTKRKIKEQIKKVDLVIGYVPALNAEFANIYAKKVGKKYFSILVACPWDGLWNQDLQRKIAAPYRYLLNRYVLLHSDYALYVTHQFLQKRYPTRGKSIGLSDVVLNKCEDSILTKRLQKISNSAGESTIKIATTAMLNVKYKGQRFVIHAIKKLKDIGYSDYEYYLIGGGDIKNLQRLAEDLEVSDKIHFVGKLPHEKIFEILDKMDIYVHPSLQEGLPRSVVEAMSRALPCIGARTGAIPELIDGDFVVRKKSADDIAEKLIELRNTKLMKKQAIRNFKESKNYECEILDKSRLEYYNSICKDIKG